MEICTTRFGKVTIQEANTVLFPEGPLGFTNYKRYALLDIDGFNPLRWLQSLEADWLAFVLLSPNEFLREKYDLMVNPTCAAEVSRCLETIELTTLEDAHVYLIVTADEEASKATANLQAPILFNPDRRLARQAILMNSGYDVRYAILEN